MDGINKSRLTETDIITKFILHAVKEVGWDDLTQIRQEVKLRDGKVVVRGAGGRPQEGEIRRYRALPQAGDISGRHRGQGQHA